MVVVFLFTARLSSEFLMFILNAQRLYVASDIVRDISGVVVGFESGGQNRGRSQRSAQVPGSKNAKRKADVRNRNR